MKSDIRELTIDIVAWRETVLMDPDPAMMLSKLQDELEELKEKPCDGHELADIGIIFFDYCDAVGIDIVKAIHWKMKINKERTWEIDKDGKLQHKRFDEGKSCKTLAYCRHCQKPIGGGTPVECLHDINEPCLIDGTGRRRVMPYSKEGLDP